MRIPTGNFGFQVASAATSDRVRQGIGAFGTSDGLGALADGLTHLSARVSAEELRLQREQDAEAKAAAKEADRVRSITAQAQAKNALADLHDELVTGITDGTVDRAKVGELQRARADKIIEDSLKGVTSEHQDVVRASLIDDIGRSQREMRKVVQAKDRADVGAGISGYMESMQRYAMRGEDQRQEAMKNVDTLLQSTGPKAGLDAAAIAKQSQAFRENVTLSWLDRAITQGQNSSKVLAQIQSDISGDKFPELDPTKRNFLEAKIQRNQQHLMAKAEIAERRNLTNLGRMEQRLSWYVENGRDIPASEMATFEKASKGTVFEGSAQMIVSEQKAVAEMMRLTPAQMGSKIKELEASYGATPSKEQVVHLEKVKRFAANSMKLLDAAPLEYATSRGGAVVQKLDLSRPDTWGENLAARTSVLIEQSQRTGAPPKGLFQEEAAALSNFLQSGSDQAKTETLKALRKGFGDDKVFRATMQQIAKDSPVTALAGTIATRERPMKVGGLFSDDTFTPGSTSALMLAGERILNPGKDQKGQDGKPTFPMPKDAEMRLKFNSMAGDAFAGNPEAYQISYQAARAAYAGLVSQKGDYSGTLNDGLLKEAVQRVTGGVADINGARVVKPWGMDDSTFKDVTRREFGRVVESAGMAAMKDQWPRMQLQNTKGGYLVKSGTDYLLDKRGNPILLRVTDPNDPSGLADRIPK